MRLRRARWVASRRNGLRHRVPAVGAVDIATTQRTVPQIAELVEDEQRMIAGCNWGIPAYMLGVVGVGQTAKGIFDEQMA